MQRQKEKKQCFYQNVQCGIKKSRFIKEKETSALLFEPNSPLKDVSFLRAIFWRYKMNEIINKFLLTGEKIMLEMHLGELDLLTVLVDH